MGFSWQWLTLIKGFLGRNPLIVLAGGAAGGVLLMQPIINKQRKQIKKLQKGYEQVLGLLEERTREIGELRIRYKQLKSIQFISKFSVKSDLRRKLIMQYGTKDYLELLIRSYSTGKVDSKKDIAFLNIFDRIIEGKTVSDKNRLLVRDYILSKHAHEIGNLEECDATQSLDRLQSVRV